MNVKHQWLVHAFQKCVFAMSLFLIASSPAGAFQVFQVFDLAIGPAAPNDQEAFKVDELILEKVQERRTQLQSRMDLLIEDVANTCELDASARTRLSVASKGAIEKTTANLEKEVKQMLQQWGVLNNLQMADEVDDDETGDEASDQRDEEDVDDLGSFSGMQKQQVLAYIDNAMQNVEYNFNVRQPEKQKLWTSTFDKTLTDEQKSKWKEAGERRLQEARKVLVAGFIAKIDFELRLDGLQKKSLTEYVDRKFGDKIVRVETDPRGKMYGGSWGGSSTEELDSDLAKILTENQQKVWKGAVNPVIQNITMVAQQLDAMDGRAQGQAAGPANEGFGRGLLEWFGF